MVGDEGRARLLGCHGERGVVLGQVNVADEPAGGLGRGDAGQRQLLGQAVLEGAERPLGAAARFW